MRGSKSTIAWRSARSSRGMSRDEAWLPESAGRPKFSTEFLTCGQASADSASKSCVVLKSHVRSRSTLLRNSESVVELPRPPAVPGASSVRRSRSEGLIRSRFASAMARGLPLQLDYTGLQERGLAHVGCEHPLAQADVGIGPEVTPFRLAAEPDLVVLHRLAAGIPCRQESHLLAPILESQLRRRPDEIAQIARRLDIDARQALARHPILLAVHHG